MDSNVVVIGGLLYNVIIIIAVSIYLKQRDKKAGLETEMMLSGRRLHWFPVAAAVSLTALGGGHINGLAIWSWDQGVAAFAFGIGCGVSMIINLRYVGVWFRRFGATTINDMFGKLFNIPKIVPVLAAMAVVYCWLVLNIETQGMASIVTALTGIPNFWAGVVCGAIGIAYVFIAGMDEIGYAGIVNAALMYIIMIIALVMTGGLIPGGWAAVNQSLLASNPELVHALANPYIFQAYAIGAFLAAFLGMAMVQGNNQGALSVQKVSVLKKACVWAIPMNVLFCTLCICLALAARTLYSVEDMLGMGLPPIGSYGMLIMIISHFPGWLQVALIGVFLSAMLTTFGILSLALVTVFSKDLLGGFAFFRNMSLRKEKGVLRVLLVVICGSAAFSASLIEANTAMALTWGMAWNIPMFAMFIIGLHWKRSRMACLVTLIFCWILNILLTFTPLREVLGMDGNTFAIFMAVASAVLGVVLTAIDRNAKGSIKKMYKAQRAAFDASRSAKRASAPAAQ